MRKWLFDRSSRPDVRRVLIRRSLVAAATIVATTILTSCGHKDDEGHGHDHGAGKAHSGHGHGEDSPAGASFKPGTGVQMTGEIRKNIGLEVADVSERQIPNQIRLTVQIFGEKHHHTINPEDHAGCDVHGSAFLPDDTVKAVKPGQPVEMSENTNYTLNGVVLAVQQALALGESEVVIGVSNAATLLKPGEFVPACINIPRDNSATVIPRAALLRTSEGAFVYTVSGDAYFRTPIEVGAEADGWVEVTDGLFAGDQVVTRPVETLYLIELRATKGGGHSH